MSWNAPQFKLVRIYVSYNGKAFQAMTSGRAAGGHTVVPWISHGGRYVFRLYTIGASPQLLRSVVVTRS